MVVGDSVFDCLFKHLTKPRWTLSQFFDQLESLFLEFSIENLLSLNHFALSFLVYDKFYNLLELRNEVGELKRRWFRLGN